MSALDVQQGGSHYKNRGIQPVEYIHRNDLSFLEGNVVKYVTRHKDKNGIEDLKKMMHYGQMLLELEYGVECVISYPTPAHTHTIATTTVEGSTNGAGALPNFTPRRK